MAVKKRSLETKASGKKEIPAELKRLAKEFYFCNKESNKASGKAGKARKALFSGMKEAGLKMFGLKARMDDNTILLDVSITLGRATSTVDIKKLRKLLGDDEKLIKFVTMSKKAIVDNFGTVVADQVCKSVPSTTESVSVAPSK